MKPEKSVRERVSALREEWIDYVTTGIVEKPKTILGSSVLFFVVAMSVVIAVGTRTTTPSEYEWELPDDKFSERRDMLYESSDDADGGLLPQQSDQTFPWYFFYDAKPRNGPNTCHKPGLLKPRNVQAMCRAERVYWGRTKYDRYCHEPPCTATSSIVRILYGDDEETPLINTTMFDCPLPNATKVQAIFDAGIDDFYFDGEARDRGYPCRARSLAYLATPLEGYDEVSQWDDKQFRKIQKRFVNRVESDLISTFNMKADPLRSVYLQEARTGISGEKFEVLWWNPYLEESQFVEAVDSDFLFAICSILFVWVWIVVHTTPFVGTFSMLQILMSIPLSLFWYRVVLQIRYLSIMQNLVVFVILGIGADDVFVYNDAWNQSEGDLKQRTKYAYSRAFQSIFNTSFTTAVAFFATAIAELVPIASFGIFAAICVIMNFALVLTVTPCIVILHHKWFGGQKSSTKKPDKWLKVYLKFVMAGEETVIDNALQGDYKGAKAKRKPVALILVLVMGAYGLTSAILASRLKPPAEQEVWFASSHMATKVDKLFDKGYGSNDATFYPSLSIVWGLDKIKRKNFDPYVPHKARGELKYSSHLDLSTDKAQAQVLSACGNLTIFPCESGCVDEHLVRPNSTVCFLQEFQAWHLETYAESTYGLGKELFDSRLSTFRDTTTPQSEDYSSWKDLIGFVDNELRFIRIQTRVSVNVEEPVVKKKQVLRRTNKFVSRFCRNIDSGLPDVWQYSEVWIWFKTQRALVRGLLIGMAIAFPVALVTLIGATQNIILATFAILTIGSIVSSVLGLAYMLGWALGIKESVAGVVVIGLSVDYTIHMGHMYDHARHEKDLYTRDDKFVFALISMGQTIIAGAITTAGSAIFLVAAQLTFFTQMGILILSTIGYSLAFSLFFYMPLLYLAGPEGDFGNLTAIKHALRAKCSSSASVREVEISEVESSGVRE